MFRDCVCEDSAKRMQRARSWRFQFTPARLVGFLLIPALLLGGTVVVSGDLGGGAILFAVSALATFARLAVGAVATLILWLVTGQPATSRRRSNR